MTKTFAPAWLGPLAKKKYQSLVKGMPSITEQQKDLVAMLSNEWETYLSAQQELQKHVDASGSMSVPGSAGQLQPHPSFKVSQAALAAYIKLSQQLRLSLGSKEVEAAPDELDDLLLGG
jgi:phage terminase small subunit